MENTQQDDDNDIESESSHFIEDQSDIEPESDNEVVGVMVDDIRVADNSGTEESLIRNLKGKPDTLDLKDMELQNKKNQQDSQTL